MTSEIQKLPTRAAIEALQAEHAKLEQADDIVTLHHFADGMYCREMRVPADRTIVGKVHKSEHFFMVISGEMELVCEGFRELVRAGFIATSRPGIKRTFYTYTDCVCVNVHNVEGLTDIEAIDAFLVEDDPTARFGPGNTLKALEQL